MQVFVVIFLVLALCVPVCASEQNSKSFSKDTIQRYLEKRWTPERIKLFCQSDTRHFGSPIGFGKKENYSGQLHKAMENSLGKVIWHFEDYGDGSNVFEIEANKGTDSWLIERSQLGLENFSDKEFKMYLIDQKLKRSFFAYQLLSKPGTKQDDIVSGFVVAAIESLQEKSDGSMEAGGVMFNNKNFKVFVGKDFSIKAILVNGKHNKYWDTAIKDSHKNMENALRLLSRCPRNVSGP